MGIVKTGDALRRSHEYGLDLVEVSPTAKPPVCRIMDYGKYKYEQEKKKKEQKKHQVQIKLKEVKFHVNVGDHDYDTKMRNLKKFIEHGMKTVVYLRDVEFHLHGGQYFEHKLLSYVANSQFTANAFAQKFHLSAKDIPPIVHPRSYLVESSREKVIFICPTPNLVLPLPPAPAGPSVEEPQARCCSDAPPPRPRGRPQAPWRQRWPIAVRALLGGCTVLFVG